MSPTARAGAAVLALVSASLVSGLLSSQPLWLRMVVSALTVVVVGSLLVLLLGAQRDRQPDPRDANRPGPGHDRRT